MSFGWKGSNKRAAIDGCEEIGHLSLQQKPNSFNWVWKSVAFLFFLEIMALHFHTDSSKGVINSLFNVKKKGGGTSQKKRKNLGFKGNLSLETCLKDSYF